jgi:hypothetical protein
MLVGDVVPVELDRTVGIPARFVIEPAKGTTSSSSLRLYLTSCKIYRLDAKPRLFLQPFFRISQVAKWRGLIREEGFWYCFLNRSIVRRINTHRQLSIKNKPVVAKRGAFRSIPSLCTETNSMSISILLNNFRVFPHHESRPNASQHLPHQASQDNRSCSGG